MKKLLALFLALTMIFALCACGQQAAPAQEASAAADTAPAADAASGETYTLILSHIQSTSTTWHKAFEYLADYCKEKSDGRLIIEIHPNSELGTEMEVVQNVITGGGIDICTSGESLSAYVEEIGAMSIPYAITSNEHAQAVLNSDIGAEWAEALTAQNLMPLAAFIRGARDITSNKEIHSVSDMKGLIIGTPDTAYTVAAFQATGAKPTVIAFNELLTALQQGTADAQENPLATIYQNSFYEAQKYLILSDHLRTWMYVLINPNSYNALPADLQAILTEGCKEMQDYEHELFLAEEAELLGMLEDAGMTVIEVDQNEFKEVLQSGVMPILTEKEVETLERIKAVDPNA